MVSWPLIIISILLSAFFSAMEMAFISSNKLRFELDKSDTSIAYSILGYFYAHPGQFISTMLVGNNIVLVVFGLQMAVLLEPIFSSFVSSQGLIVLLQSIVSTLIILFTGEFIPKILAKFNPNFSMRIFTFPLAFFYVILYPISLFTSFLSYVALKIFRTSDNVGTVDERLGRVDLDHYIHQIMTNSQDDSEMNTEVKIFQNALAFSNVRLRDCMVPRTEIIACDLTIPKNDLRTMFVETGFSKIVVYKENIDNIVGYIHSSELFIHPDNWQENIYPLSFVPESLAAKKLMKLLMEEKKSMAVVVDELGGTAGIVTLEDLVEEIFGEIEDEHDTKSYVAKELSEGEYLLSGRVEIDEVNDMFNLNLPVSDDYMTIAGLILHYYQNFPSVNDLIEVEKYTFKVLKVAPNKIDLVKLKVEDN